MEVVVRSCRPGEAGALAEIFHRAVREGAAGAYTEEERAAWSPEAPSGAAWLARTEGAETVVAEAGGVPVGFMSLVMAEGYLDFAYVLPEVKGRGVAAALYAVLESRARAAGLGRLTTEASLLAEPFFARQGWSLVRRQTVERRGVPLRNAVMEKRLCARPAQAGNRGFLAKAAGAALSLPDGQTEPGA